MASDRWALAASSFVVGALTAIQARINSQLGTTMGNSLEAAVVSFGTGLLALSAVLAFSARVRRGLARLPGALRDGSLKWWQVLGGVLGGFFVAVQTAVVPLLGVAIFTVAVVAGQSSNSLVVDRIGLGPAGPRPITPRRLLSAVLAVVAVLVAVSSRVVADNVSVVAVVVAFVGGLAIAFQAAINGRVSTVTGHPMSAAYMNFLFGAIALGAAFGVSSGVGGHSPSALPSGPWWLYLGGLLGLAFIAVAAWVVPKLGVLVFALLAIAGQLFGALLLDIFAPNTGSHVEWTLVAGVAIALVAVSISALPARAASAPSGS